MKNILLLAGCLCFFAEVSNAQGYRGSDSDLMMYQRMQQHSQQNSYTNTYTPRQSIGSQYHSYQTTPSARANVEKVIQGVYVYNNQLAVVRLRYYGGKITHYSTSKDMMGREQWQSMYPDNPHPTNSMADGQLAREYQYKVSIQSTTIYFNL